MRRGKQLRATEASLEHRFYKRVVIRIGPVGVGVTAVPDAEVVGSVNANCTLSLLRVDIRAIKHIGLVQ
jgi:hypothetical protein